MTYKPHYGSRKGDVARRSQDKAARREQRRQERRERVVEVDAAAAREQEHFFRSQGLTTVADQWAEISARAAEIEELAQLAEATP